MDPRLFTVFAFIAIHALSVVALGAGIVLHASIARKHRSFFVDMEHTRMQVREHVMTPLIFAYVFSTAIVTGITMMFFYAFLF